MADESDSLLAVALEIRELIRLLAEPAVAERDQKPRAAVRSIVGRSSAKANAVLLMDGSRTQSEISHAIKFDKSDLSKLIKSLRAVRLLGLEDKPKLKISIPANFFETQEA